MRKLAVTLALASTALSTPALARDDAWYVGVEGGAMLVEDINFDVDGGPDAGKVDNEAGWDVDGVIGYDFGGFRLEAEVGYRRATVDAITTNFPFVSSGFLHQAGTYDGAGGSTSALSFMVNGMLDFGDDDGLQGFVGGGAGVARVSSKYGISTAGDLLDDSDTVFAWQAFAGLRAPLSDSIDIQLKYRFFNADNVKLIALNGSEVEGRYRSHSLVGGLVFNFGEPPAPPPPVEPPAPPPPPPTSGGAAGRTSPATSSCPRGSRASCS